MPTYPYLCACGHREDVIKSIKDCESPEPCPKCSQIMSVNYGDPGWAKAGAMVFKGHFNCSLGRYIGSAGDIRDAQNKIQDATGSRPIELGNERPVYKPVKQDVDMRDVVAYAEKLQTDRGEAVNHG